MSRPTVLAAVLQGKLGKVKTSEDLLTSIVFGTLAWMPPKLGMGAVLGQLEPTPPWLQDIVRIDIELWPWWDHDAEQKGAEPDVVLTLHRELAQPLLLVVEAKRKSSLGPSQLLRQAASGNAVATQRGAQFVGLVYLTEHMGLPSELAMAAAEVHARYPELPVWWASWRDIWPLLEKAAVELEPVSPMVAAAAQDAAGCLKRWGLLRFQGWSDVPSFPAWSVQRS